MQQISHRHVLGDFQRLSVFKGDRMEANTIARLHLPDFPQLRFRDSHRANKPAEAWAVTRQNHREIAGKIHRANRIFAVMNIGRMQARFSTVSTRPLRFRANQPHAEAVGVVVNLPFGLKKCLHGFRREEIRRAVWPVQHADFPHIAVLRNHGRFRCLRQ
ncbi:hypothetical protein D3C75_800300 [compost metagenome]